VVNYRCAFLIFRIERGIIMSSRFGAATTRSRTAKLKILIGCMVLLLVILLFLLIYVVQNANTASSSATTSPEVEEVKEAVTQDSIGILIPVFRVEEGVKLSSQMFNTEYLPKEKVPVNAVTADKLGLMNEKFSRRLINPNVPLLMDDISDTQPLSAIDIPAGYRLITIIVDSRSGVEGWAKPSTRVDVLWTFMQDRRKKIATIARFVKVISVAGKAGNAPEDPRVDMQGPVTVSLLVSEEQAKYIELARTTGELSLVLVGGKEIPTDISDEPKIFDINEILRQTPQKVEEEEVAADGVLYVEDPATGKQKKYVLRRGRWALDKTYSE
jgi:Flp pilus assembly protein CpaB